MTSERAVLWVTAEPPDHTRHGGSIRQAYLLDALAPRFEVDLLVAGEVADERVRSAAHEVIEVPSRPAVMTEDAVFRRLLELTITLGSRYPLTAYMSGPARRRLRRRLGRSHDGYDVICVEHEALAPLIRPGRARWVITFHHLLSGMAERDAGLAPGRRQRWYRERDAGKARRIESHAVTAYDRCIAVSEQDAQQLARLGGNGVGDRLAVVPNGVDLARFAACPVPAEPRVLFPGTLHYSPNVDGAVWFCSEIWPLVREQVPDASLVLAGRDPSAEVQSLAQIAGVEVHADVPSMVPYFKAARVVVVPLRIGTGTRLKALEAMASGRPVVGTSEGLAGLGVRDGVEARLADGPADFATALVETVLRDDLATALGAAGRRHVEQHFGWDTIGDKFVSTVADLVENERR